jgi:RimJ/RimL family protein N-acetyltransferase
MVLREASLSDLPAIVDLQQVGAVTALAHIFPQETYPFPRAAIRSRWEDEIADPGVHVYVIERNEGRVVGFAAIQGDTLLHFGTAVETWGSGLATAAHGQLVERFAATGVSRARLRVFTENHRARRFYEKLGWRRSHRLSRSPFPPRPVLMEYVLDL